MVSWHRGTDIRATNHTHHVICLLSLPLPCITENLEDSYSGVAAMRGLLMREDDVVIKRSGGYGSRVFLMMASFGDLRRIRSFLVWETLVSKVSSESIARAIDAVEVY